MLIFFFHILDLLLIKEDNYLFSYDQKIDIMHKDYHEMIKSVNQRMKL